jgi:hypothetical protein
VGDGKNFDCIFGFSVKSYVRNTINMSWTKILLSSAIRGGTKISLALMHATIVIKEILSAAVNAPI